MKPSMLGLEEGGEDERDWVVVELPPCCLLAACHVKRVAWDQLLASNISTLIAPYGNDQTTPPPLSLILC
eukprot:158024-Hanusia_phi.AAC.1